MSPRRIRTVFVSRYDGHIGLANSVALVLAGVTAETPDPPGGTVVREAQGNATGALKDSGTYRDLRSRSGFVSYSWLSPSAPPLLCIRSCDGNRGTAESFQTASGAIP